MIIRFIAVAVLALLATWIIVSLRNFYGLKFYPWYELAMLTQGYLTGVIVTWKPNVN